jgi:predicted hotdog family 3-hydroxylacyl-ACP dehydratase
MCLLDRAVAWSAIHILCEARSHLDPRNPLRRNGRLGTLCGLEYGLQAAALHGALAAGETPQPPGYLAALRDVALHAPYLDDPALTVLRVEATLEHRNPAALLYMVRIGPEAAPFATARALIALPRAAP